LRTERWPARHTHLGAGKRISISDTGVLGNAHYDLELQEAHQFAMSAFSVLVV
ncbi:MAG: hypothetical protein RL169_2015, partial [Armatimonadota bacterium]